VSDSVIDAIRQVDPCPEELGPPPIDMVHRRLAEAPDLDSPARRSRRPNVSAMAVTASSLVVVAVAVLAIALLGHAHRRGRTVQPSSGVTACHSTARVGVLPPWARSGFSDPRPRMRYALGRSGQIAAILWGSLNSPPAADHNNKILWVSRTPVAGTLHIHAQRMSGTKRLGAPVSREVAGGPGPSIIDLPESGCWRMTLRWAGRTDHLDLRYLPNSSAPVPIT